ncbi:hypothetical protein [Nocardioides stalactiti]|nr:hypothetical protein [Nocardioides stalactiti]
MHYEEMAGRPALEMRWVPVTDERGTTRMQAVWIDTAPVTQHYAA